MLSKQQTEEFKQRLLKEKEKTTSNIEQRDTDYDEGELSSYDNHPADSGDELFLRERDQAITDMQEDMLSDVDRALKAIEDGTYGICEVCGKEIEFERLDIIPETRLCIEHAKEEAEQNGDTDGFSKVSDFGSSDTPSDQEDGIDPTRS